MKNSLRAIFGYATNKIASLFLRKEFFLIGCAAIVVGFLFIGPPLAIGDYFNAREDKFVLAQLKTYRDELYMYVPRAREVYDGHFPPAELSLDQQGPSPRNALPSLMFGLAIFLFKGNVTAAYLLIQFLFSAIIFLLLYAAGRLLFKSKSWSLFFAMTGVLTPILANVFSFDFKNDPKILFDYTFKQFIPVIRTQIDKLRLARIDHSLLVYPVYLTAIITFIRFWLKPKYSYAVAAALPAALLAYTYFSTWIYWATVMVIMAIAAALFYPKDRQLLKGFGVLFVVFGILLLPYFVNYFMFRVLPAAEDISYRSAVLTGHNFGFHKKNLLDYLFYFITILAVGATYFRNIRVIDDKFTDKYKKGLLFFGFVIAAILVWNLQMFIGQSTVPTKWRYPVAVTLYIIWIALLSDWTHGFRNSFRIKNVIKIGVVVLSLMVFSKYVVNIISLRRHPNPETLLYYKFPNEVVDSWDWINNNLESEPRIISPSYVTSIYLMAYTSARPFLPRAHLSLASNFELEERLITARKLFGVPSNLFRQQLEGTMLLNCSSFGCFPDTGINLNKTFFQLYGDGFKKTFAEYFDGKTGLPAGRIDELMGCYNSAPAGVISSVPADYVYYSPWEKQLGSRVNLAENRNLNLIYRNSSVEIYKITKP